MRRQTIISAILGATALLSGCNGSGVTEEEWKSEPLLPPSLSAVTPTVIHLGDKLTIIGSDFPHGERGGLSLHLDGKFIDEDGLTHDYSGEVELETVDTGVATSDFETVIFHQEGNKLGTFLGSAYLVTTPYTRTEADDPSPSILASEKMSVEVTVGPSIFVRRLRPVGGNCQSVTNGTRENTQIEIELQGLGIGEASAENRWEFEVQFASPDLTATYVAEEFAGLWPRTKDYAAQTQDGVSSFRGTVRSGTVFAASPSRQPVVSISKAINISGKNITNGLVLADLVTGTVGAAGYDKTIALGLTIRTADGKSLQRAYAYNMSKELVPRTWNVETKVVERTAPAAIGGCVYAWPREQEMRYSASETIHKGVTIGHREDIGSNQQVGFSFGDFNFLQVQGHNGWTETFGTDINQQIATDNTEGRDRSIQIIPGYYGMAYRQEIKYEKTVDLIHHGICGTPVNIGEMVMHNWEFEVSLDQGPTCPPESHFPPTVHVETPAIVPHSAITGEPIR